MINVNGNGQMMIVTEEGVSQGTNTPGIKIANSRSRINCKLPILQPHQKFRLTWEIFILVLIIWVAISEPFNMTFLTEYRLINSSSAIDAYLVINSAVTDTAFMLDIIINFRTSIVDKKTGEEITDPKVIAKRYIFHGPFVLDLMASIPWFIIEQILTSEYSRLTRLFRLFRLFRLTKLLVRLNAKQTLKYSVKFMQLFMMIILLCHWGACIWYEIILIDKKWRTGQDLFYGVDFYSQEIWTQYLMCLYYNIIMQTQGSEIWPTSTLETGIVVLFELAGLLITTILYTNILFFIDQYTLTTERVDKKTTLAESVSETMNLPAKLRVRIIEHITKHTKRHIQQKEWIGFLNDLPSSISRVVMISIFGNLLKNTETKATMSDYDFNRLVERLKPHAFKPEECPFVLGQPAEHLYIVCSGQVAIFLESLNMNGTSEEFFTEIIDMLNEGEIFGAGGLLCLRKKYTYSAKCLMHSVIVSLERKVFKEVFMEKYPSLFNHIKLDVDSRHLGLKKLTQEFRQMLPYLSEINNTPEEFHIFTSVQRHFVRENQVIVQKGSTTPFVFYVEQGCLQLNYPLRGEKIELEDLKSGSVYGLYSILSKDYKYFQIQATADSLLQIISAEDLKKLRNKFPDMNSKCLLAKELKKNDFVSICKEVVEPMDFSEKVRRSSRRQSIFKALLNRCVFVERVNPRMKLKRCLLTILSGTNNKNFASLFSLAKLKKMQRKEQFTRDSELQGLVRQILDSYDRMRFK